MRDREIGRRSTPDAVLRLAQLGRQIGIVSLALLASCPISTTKTGVDRPPRSPECELTLISPSDIYPGSKYAADYEMIGTISLVAKTGALATDPEVKGQVRPEACAMGAELIALKSSTVLRNMSEPVGQTLVFEAYAKRVISTPQKY